MSQYIELTYAGTTTPFAILVDDGGAIDVIGRNKHGREFAAYAATLAPSQRRRVEDLAVGLSSMIAIGKPQRLTRLKRQEIEQIREENDKVGKTI